MPTSTCAIQTFHYPSSLAFGQEPPAGTVSSTYNYYRILMIGSFIAPTARFDGTYPHSCAFCEFRQCVNGTVAGRPAPGTILTKMSKRVYGNKSVADPTWPEDGTPAGLRYGHRAETPDEYSLCTFFTEDFPGISNAAPQNAFSYNVNFRGKIVDIHNGDAIRDCKFVKVTLVGSVGVAGTIGPIG